MDTLKKLLMQLLIIFGIIIGIVLYFLALKPIILILGIDTMDLMVLQIFIMSGMAIHIKNKIK